MEKNTIHFFNNFSFILVSIFSCFFVIFIFFVRSFVGCFSPWFAYIVLSYHLLLPLYL